jgi:hypothetical protein
MIGANDRRHAGIRGHASAGGAQAGQRLPGVSVTERRSCKGS